MKKKTITRTFRINVNYDYILQEEAERQKISVNLLLNKILREFTLYGRFTDRIQNLSIPNRTLKEFIQDTPEDIIVSKAEKFASLDTVDFFNIMGYSRDYETFIDLIKEHFGSTKFAKWFLCFHHSHRTQDLFHLQHNLGRKWSVFIDSYFQTILNQIIHTKVESTIYDFAVTLKVSRPLSRKKLD